MTDQGYVSANAFWNQTSGTTNSFIVYGAPHYAIAEDRLKTPTEWLRDAISEVCRLAR